MRPSASTKSHKWAANIGIIIGSTKLFLSFLFKFSPHFQSLDPFDSYYGESGVLEQLRKAKKPEPQGPLQDITYRKKHLRKGQYIENHTDAQHYEPCAKGKPSEPTLGLTEKYPES